MRKPIFRTPTVLLALMLATPLGGRGQGPERIWILPFSQPQPDPSLEYLQEALPALLMVAATGVGERHLVVERQKVNAILAEQSLTLSGLTSPESKRRIGTLLGATAMVTGSFSSDGGRLLVTMRASDLETGVIVATAEGDGVTGQLGDLVGRLYRQLADGLEGRLPELPVDQIDDAPLANLHFMKGLGHYHSARYSHALAEFMLAAEDPHVTGISRLWLADTYLAQEQYAHAYLELVRLAGSESDGVRPSDVATRMRVCEQHLSAADVDVIRDLVVRAAAK